MREQLSFLNESIVCQAVRLPLHGEGNEKRNRTV
jgi:hypothetical protein